MGGARGGGARRIASGVLIAKVIVEPPWDSPARLGGVSTIMTCPSSCSGVTVVLSRPAIASRAFSSLPAISAPERPRASAFPCVFFF